VEPAQLATSFAAHIQGKVFGIAKTHMFFYLPFRSRRFQNERSADVLMPLKGFRQNRELGAAWKK
jgi:hypothetical protein